MRVEEKIEAFEKMAVSAAQEKKRQAAADMESRFSSLVEEAVREEARRSRELVRAERYKVERGKNKELVDSSSRTKREFITCRESLTAGLFDAVLSDLKSFTASPEYEKFLLEKIKSAVQTGQYEAVQLTKNDMRYADAVASAAGLSVEEASEDFIGGFRLIGSGRRAMADHTLAGRLNEQRANFSLIAAEVKPTGAK